LRATLFISSEKDAVRGSLLYATQSLASIDLKKMKPRSNEEHEAKNAKSEALLALLRGLPSSSSLLRGEIPFSRKL
jgi:hypothetical protein